MRIEWLVKKDHSRVVVFFNGWGMDRMAIAHLSGDIDVVMINDYRTLETTDFPVLENYRKIHIVAWSMGVWAAANVIPRLGVQPTTLIALNGTEHPINDKWGIPPKIYQLTEKGMNEQGRAKFMQRMLSGKEEIERFQQNQPSRSVGEVCEELACIRIQSNGLQNKLQWNKVYISEGDVIFPVQNQINWWQDKNICLRTMPGGHYPFYHFQSWEDIIES